MAPPLDHSMHAVLQGSAHLQEDLRTPPFLCPIDFRKLLFVTGSDAVERYTALLAFCDRADMRGIETFAAFAAWLRLQALSPAVGAESKSAPASRA
jgi:hypothetical protein